MREALLGTIFAALMAATSATAQVTRLLGMTPVDQLNNGTLVEIDAMTGAAATLASFSVSRGARTGPIAWHDPSGSILMLWPNTNGDGGFLAQMAPGVGQMNVAPITGLPAGQTGLGGLAYDAGRGRVLITFGATAASNPDRVAEIDLTGAVQQTTLPLTVGARDAISVQESTGDVLLCDFDGPPPRVVAAQNLFTTPSFTALGDPPVDATIFDVASDPFFTPVFVVENFNHTLLQVSGNSFVPVGPLGIPDDIVGLEAITCQFDLGLANSPMRLMACGGTMRSGSPAQMTLFPIPQGVPCALLFGASGSPLPLPPPWSGTLATNPVLFTVGVVPQGPGFFGIRLPGGGGPFALAVQAVCVEPATFQIQLSNALLITVFP